jgi:predicted ferric reductase
MYCFILAFWVHLCKKRTYVSWLSTKSKMIILVVNIIVFCVIIIIPFLYIFAPKYSFVGNVIIAIVVVGNGIGRTENL